MLGGIVDKASGLLRWAKHRMTGSGEYNPEPVVGNKKNKSLSMQPKTPEDYVKYVNERYDRWYQARYAYEANWYLDVAYYLGLQWHEWNEQSRTLREPRAPSHRVRYVSNQCMPVIETMVGKMTRGQPDMTCVPAQSPSDRAFMDARMGDKLLKAKWDPMCQVEVNQEWLYWGFICGHAYQKTMWDPTRGRPIRIPGEKTMYEGDIVNLAIGPYSIVTPPYLKNPNIEPGEKIECRMFDVEHARMMFPEVADKIEPKQDNDRTTSYEERLAQLVSPLGYSGFGEKQASKSSKVMVKEHWQDPQVLSEEEREEFPDGRTIITVDSVFVGAINNPYGFDPFTDMRAKVIPGRYQGGSIIDQLIAIQRNYNSARSDVIESRRLCARPMVNVEAGHGIVKPVAEPGKWLERRKGWAAPVFLDPPRMSDYHVKDLADTREDFQGVSQIREVTRGEIPSANITGVAINLLQEADNTPLGPLAQRIARAYGQIGKKVVMLAQKFYREPRMLSITGEGHETEVVEFLGDRHQTELAVRCSVSSILPESRAAKQSRVLEATQAGVVLPQEKIRKMLEFGDPNEIWEEDDGHAQKAMRENKKLIQGIPVPVDTFDNDLVHMARHDRFRVSTEYEQLSPQIRFVFDDHCNQHLEKQKLLSQMTAGAAAPPPAPSAAPSQDPALAGDSGLGV